MLLVVALARVMQAMSWSVLKQQARLNRANIEYVLLAGSALFLCKRVYFCVLERVCMCDVGGTMILKGKWLSERWDPSA